VFAVTAFAVSGPVHALGRADVVYYLVLAGLVCSAIAVPLGLLGLRHDPAADPKAEPRAHPAAEPNAHPAADPKADPAADLKAHPAAERAVTGSRPEAQRGSDPTEQP